jgi:hypothetical protein
MFGRDRENQLTSKAWRDPLARLTTLLGYQILCYETYVFERMGAHAWSESKHDGNTVRGLTSSRDACSGLCRQQITGERHRN